MKPFYALLFLILLIPATAGAEKTLCEKVTDGDTIEITGGVRVRLIGIDTPETRRGRKLYADSERTGEPADEIIRRGKEATEFLKTFFTDSRAVRLEYDIQKLDKYGRVLAYVYAGDIFLNAELIRAGYARLMTIPPNVKHTDLFLRIYRERRGNGKHGY
jgi:micrococcal nuclease